MRKKEVKSGGSFDEASKQEKFTRRTKIETVAASGIADRRHEASKEVRARVDFDEATKGDRRAQGDALHHPASGDTVQSLRAKQCQAFRRFQAALGNRRFGSVLICLFIFGLYGFLPTISKTAFHPSRDIGQVLQRALEITLIACAVLAFIGGCVFPFIYLRYCNTNTS